MSLYLALNWSSCLVLNWSYYLVLTIHFRPGAYSWTEVPTFETWRRTQVIDSPTLINTLQYNFNQVSELKCFKNSKLMQPCLGHSGAATAAPEGTEWHTHTHTQTHISIHCEHTTSHVIKIPSWIGSWSVIQLSASGEIPFMFMQMNFFHLQTGGRNVSRYRMFRKMYLQQRVKLLSRISWNCVQLRHSCDCVLC
jgi:hypothetical protein